MDDTSAPNQGDPDHQFDPPPPPTNTDYHHARWPSLPIRVLRPSARSAGEPRRSKPGRPLVLVVGVCSAGKSTLVRNLREKGYTALACAQEHSWVPRLWQRSRPDVLVFLDASIHAVRERRKVRWHRVVLEEEQRRLSHAREHCDLYIYTDGLLPEDVASRVVTFLNNRKL